MGQLNGNGGKGVFGAPRPNSKIQPRGQQQVTTQSSSANLRDDSNEDVSKESLLHIVKTLNEKVESLNKVSLSFGQYHKIMFVKTIQILKEKDGVIEKQRTEITNLRKKNFEFRSKVTELQDKEKL